MSRDHLLFFDSETVGFHGMPVLFQYAEGDGEIVLYNVWKEPVGKTLDLIGWFLEHAMVFFNATFDFFHLAKCYTIWRLLPRDWIPEDHIHEIAMLEPQGQEGPCIKPASACDLLLHSRKNEYQSLMARDDIRIRRVPTALAYALAEKLEEEIEIDGIFFAKAKDKDAPRWRVYDVKRHGEIEPDFKDVVLKFKPAGGLKFLAEFALGYTPKFHFEDVELPKKAFPIEYGFAPTALAVSKPDVGWAVYEEFEDRTKITGRAWPALVKLHIEHWANNEDAREYARDDIVYTRALYDHFGQPEPGDNDSVLACMVPVVRWHGFKIDKEGMKGLREKAQQVVDNAPVNVNAPTQVRDYLMAAMDETEGMFIEETTKKAKLEAIKDWLIDEEGEECTRCFAASDPDCKRCGGTGMLKPGPHPAAERAKQLLDVKKAVKEIEIYDKLLHAKKFHASFNIIGTMSSRMSGGDGLNPQGIKKTKEVRRMFPLAWEGYVLSLGDFSSYEVTLADAVYNDPKLRAALVGGKKVHGLFGMALFPGKTYEEILASEGTDFDMYTMAKSGVFAMIYGGNADTLHRNLGIPKDVAQAAYEEWGRMFPGIEKARNRILRNFCSMKQPGGIGSQVIWDTPADYCETFLGFRRYFTLENMVCKKLFDLARKPPREWRKCPVKVVRRDRIQTAGGAVASALYGAAFGIQAANMRAAANHEIQSPGGEICKHVQRKIWDLQPAGVHEWRVATANIHDEILCVNHPDYTEDVVDALRDGVEHFREKVPLIGMDWFRYADSWANKSGGQGEEKITYDREAVLRQAA